MNRTSASWSTAAVYEDRPPIATTAGGVAADGQSAGPLACDAGSIRVFLVEDDVGFQRIVETAIRASGDIVLTGVASTCRQAFDVLERNAAIDVLVVDLGLPDGSGLDVIRDASRRWPECSIMVSTAFGDETHVVQSLEAGAVGYILKDSSRYGIADEIRSLHAGGSPISPLIARKLLLRFRNDPHALSDAASTPAAIAPAPVVHVSLSERERVVLEYMTKGFTAEEIAALIAVSRHTVNTFVRRIYRKLEVSSKAEAIYEARQQGLLQS